MNDDRERPPAPAASSSTDLLDLVRSAEETARLRVRKRTPAAPMAVSARGRARLEQVVDIDDEAEDAPSTLPPMPAGVRARDPALSAGEGRAQAARTTVGGGERSTGWSPAAGIVLVLALAVAALVVLAR